MAVRLKKYSFRFSEELFNSRLAQKAEIEQMPEYRLKTPALARKVVGLYRKIEQGTVLAYKKIEDRFVDAFLEKVENAAQKEDEEAQADAGTRD